MPDEGAGVAVRLNRFCNPENPARLICWAVQVRQRRRTPIGRALVTCASESRILLAFAHCCYRSMAAFPPRLAAALETLCSAWACRCSSVHPAPGEPNRLGAAHCRCFTCGALPRLSTASRRLRWISAGITVQQAARVPVISHVVDLQTNVTYEASDQLIAAVLQHRD